MNTEWRRCYCVVAVLTHNFLFAERLPPHTNSVRGPGNEEHTQTRVEQYVIGSEKTYQVEKTYCHIISDYYKTAHVLYLAFYFILIERSETKSHLFLKIPFTEKKLKKSRLKLKFYLQKKYSVFLRKSVLHNYIFIPLRCAAYI